MGEERELENIPAIHIKGRAITTTPIEGISEV